MSNLEQAVSAREQEKYLKQRAYNVGLCPECGVEMVTNQYPEKKVFFGLFYNEGQLLKETYCPVNKSHVHTKIFLETC